MGNVVQIYEERLAGGQIDADPAQAAAVERLDRLAGELQQRKESRRGWLGGLLAARNDHQKGLYVYGAVGRGKTMLMDLFYEACEHPAKRRVHFHEFMAEVHERIARGRATSDGDPIPFVAGEIASESSLLCFDELHVTDIADAMILSRLFKVLFEKGTVVVATSNAAPDKLYWNGLNRQLFLPFVALLEANVDTLELCSARDFRLEKLAGRQLYFTPANVRAATELDAHWQRLTGGHEPLPAHLEVKGRRVLVPKAAMGVARFTFADLCEQPLGALDYLHIAHAFHTVIIDAIPALSPAKRNEARRFITLIDTLYDNRVCLIASAEAEPHRLYPAGDGARHFERTASRLMEMRSEAYLAGPDGQGSARARGRVTA